jgi:tetratricopeptide (TPR) repeat protein
VKEAEFLYTKANYSEDDLIIEAAKLKMEKARTLLRIGDVEVAYGILSAMLAVKTVFSFRFCFFALLHKSEACIRLNKYEEAYQDCSLALKVNLGNNDGGNFGVLSLCSCIYNMAIAKFKMQDYGCALRHFNEFFNKIHKFCKGFLDENTLRELEIQKAFDNITIESQTYKCLENSLKIFTAIFGKEHAFIKNYIAKNCVY